MTLLVVPTDNFTTSRNKITYRISISINMADLSMNAFSPSFPIRRFLSHRKIRTTTDCRENDYLAEVRQLRLEDKRTLQLTSQNPNLQKVDCKKSRQVPTSHLFNRVPVFLGAGDESGVHPRSLLLLAGDIETNPGLGTEIIDVLDSGNELSTVEYERLDSSSNSIHIVRGNEDIQELNWGIWGLGMLIVVMD